MNQLLTGLVCACALTTSVGCLKDLRPTQSQAVVAAVSSDPQAVGIQKLRESFDVVGCQALTTHRTARARMSDKWNGIFALASPWPTSDVDVDLEMQLGTRSVRAKFYRPEDAPDWIVIDDVPSVLSADGTRIDGGENQRFIMRALQYFFEYCARAQEHTHIRYAGQETFVSDGVERTYDVIYATWGDGEARDDVDQYLIYIDQKSRRIGKLQYTIRDSSAALVGTMHYSDFRVIKGATIPFRMAVTFDIHDDTDAPLHEVLVTGFAFDNAELSAGIPVGAAAP